MMNLKHPSRFLLTQLRRNFTTHACAYCAANGEVPDKIGIIGLGQMGSRMAAALLHAGQQLVVCDQSAEAMRKAEDLGAVTVSSPAALVSTEGVRVLISMLPSSSNVRDAYLNSNDGVLAAEGAIRPSLLIDCSTISPPASRAVSEAIQAALLHHESRPFEGCSAAHPAMIDAPVSGGITAASAATLTFMVGGSRPAARAAEQYLKMMGKDVLYLGGAGNGQAAKVCNNLALAIQMASVAEAMALGISLGLDAKDLAGVFNISSSRCWSSDSYNPVPGVQEGVPASRDYRGGFAAKHMTKDIGLAIAASEANGGMPILPMARQALQLYRELEEVEPLADFGAIFKYVYGGGRTAA